jgi:hypothetical protein
MHETILNVLQNYRIAKVASRQYTPRNSFKFKLKTALAELLLHYHVILQHHAILQIVSNCSKWKRHNMSHTLTQVVSVPNGPEH